MKITLTEFDLGGLSKNRIKNITDVRIHDFPKLTQELINYCEHIEYTDGKDTLILKNRYLS